MFVWQTSVCQATVRQTTVCQTTVRETTVRRAQSTSLKIFSPVAASCLLAAFAVPLTVTGAAAASAQADRFTAVAKHHPHSAGAAGYRAPARYYAHAGGAAYRDSRFMHNAGSGREHPYIPRTRSGCRAMSSCRASGSSGNPAICQPVRAATNTATSNNGVVVGALRFKGRMAEQRGSPMFAWPGGSLVDLRQASPACPGRRAEGAASSLAERENHGFRRFLAGPQCGKYATRPTHLL